MNFAYQTLMVIKDAKQKAMRLTTYAELMKLMGVCVLRDVKFFL